MNIKNPKLYAQMLAQHRERKRKMRALRDAGASFGQIGAVFGVTRQRVAQILGSGK